MIEDLKNQTAIYSLDISRIGKEIKANKSKSFSYPKRKFGKAEMRFLPARYEKWTWLHNGGAEYHVLCIIYKNANNHRITNNVKVGDSF